MTDARTEVDALLDLAARLEQDSWNAATDREGSEMIQEANKLRKRAAKLMREAKPGYWPGGLSS